jgi:hypothetical protein
MKAYRQDYIAIATLVTSGNPARLAIADITKDSMRTAFAAYAHDHEAASIRRCWSTWNVLCTLLYTGEHLAANPMQLVGDPNWPGPSPRPSPASPSKRFSKPLRRIKTQSEKPTGLKEISRSSSPHSWPASAPRNCAWLISAIFAPPMTAPRSST